MSLIEEIYFQYCLSHFKPEHFISRFYVITASHAEASDLISDIKLFIDEQTPLKDLVRREQFTLASRLSNCLFVFQRYSTQAFDGAQFELYGVHRQDTEDYLCQYYYTERAKFYMRESSAYNKQLQFINDLPNWNY